MQVFNKGDVLKRRRDVPERWMMWTNRCVWEKIDPFLPQEVINSSPSLGVQLELMPHTWWQGQWFEKVGPVIEKDLEDYL